MQTLLRGLLVPINVVAFRMIASLNLDTKALLSTRFLNMMWTIAPNIKGISEDFLFSSSQIINQTRIMSNKLVLLMKVK